MRVATRLDLIVPRAHALIRHRAERYMPETIFDMGRSLVRREGEEKEIERLQQALRYSPEEAISAAKLGDLLLREGKYAEAHAWLAKAFDNKQRLPDGGTRVSQNMRLAERFLEQVKAQRMLDREMRLTTPQGASAERPRWNGRRHMTGTTLLLAIETSCDETAAAVVADGRAILSNVVASQIDLHRRYGGVFPEVASRQHVLSIVPVIEEAMQQAGAGWNDLAAVAVTEGPGLAGSLLVGVNAAKGLAFSRGLPLVGVNHLEGHVYSNWLAPWMGERESGRAGEREKERERERPDAAGFPVLVLIVSGGHTELVLMEDHGQYRRLGGTLDDAAGEAFDKAARLLGLPYPGGPVVQRAAEGGDPTRFDLPRAVMNNPDHRYNFSFSGLKTAVLRLVREQQALVDDENWPAGYAGQVLQRSDEAAGQSIAR